MLHNSSEFMPYVIFIAAPGMELLKQLYSFNRSTGTSSRNLTVSIIHSQCLLLFVICIWIDRLLAVNIFETIVNPRSSEGGSFAFCRFQIGGIYEKLKCTGLFRSVNYSSLLNTLLYKDKNVSMWVLLRQQHIFYTIVEQGALVGMCSSYFYRGFLSIKKGQQHCLFILIPATTRHASQKSFKKLMNYVATLFTHVV